MKLQFKYQQFQTNAVNAVVDIFTGQENKTKSYLMDMGKENTLRMEDVLAFGNPELTLNEREILNNLQNVQKRNKVEVNLKLEKLSSNFEIEGKKKSETIKHKIERPVFSVEMETGTGKTYTYIKTIYELNKKYSWSKFIIIVPSIAIREGVYKSFQIMQDHFKSEYGKACEYFIYNSNRLSELEAFATSSNIQVMIMNTQAFNAKGADNRRIYMELDTFKSRKPIEVIAKTNPIIIVDEPQSVLGVEAKKNTTRDSIGRFNPLFYINYSATHRENFNMVYRLDAVDAYQKQLVKKISVKGIIKTNSQISGGYIYLQKINVYPNKSPTANVVFEYNLKTKNNLSRKVSILNHGDNLYTHSNEVEAYKNNYIISEINALENYVEFANGIRINLGELIGENNELDIRKIQIRETIISHFEKERELFKKGIKVLSLFFIDEVVNYKKYTEGDEEEKGIYAEIFEKEYVEAKNHFLETLPFAENKEYREFLERDEVNKVHAGYFSIDKKGKMVDSKIKRGESESDDISAYDLIMKDKERLLSQSEPVRFIFSHSALKEGWDNPNVFQICTLRESSAEIKKRQEIGRGLRLCVNNLGERMDAEALGYDTVHDINVLTVIASESYDSFAKSLQEEFKEILKNRPTKITPELFKDKIYLDQNGNEKIIDSSQAAEIYVKLKTEKIINSEGQLEISFKELNSQEQTKKIKELLESINKELGESGVEVVKLIESVYDLKNSEFCNNGRNEISLQLDQEKFASKEFKKLWEKINTKTYYTVKLDEKKFIETCIKYLDEKLSVNVSSIKVEVGDLKIKDENIKMNSNLGKDEKIIEENNYIKYDLLSEIGKSVELKRSSVANILSKINKDKFGLFKKSPESFIRNVSKLIKEKKSTTIIEHLVYNKLEEKWSKEEIFTENQIKGHYGINVIDTPNKHIYDKLRYDSSIEETFAKKLDISDMVNIFVKLPRGFYIETPMGKYNPDWAIVFEEEKVKHIYFVAETKGDNSDIQLRGEEKAKIECAKKHFAEISNKEIVYNVVDSYEKLLELVS